MFKTIITLMRGRAFDAEQRLKDDNALALLDQQMRDAAGAVDRPQGAGAGHGAGSPGRPARSRRKRDR